MTAWPGRGQVIAVRLVFTVQSVRGSGYRRLGSLRRRLVSAGFHRPVYWLLCLMLWRVAGAGLDYCPTRQGGASDGRGHDCGQGDLLDFHWGVTCLVRHQGA